MAVNCFVLMVVLFVDLSILSVGIYHAGFAGVLEMDGFKDSFAHLYNNSLKDDNASDVGSNQTRGCSAGNGAESDSVIGFVVSSSNIGAVIGSLASGFMADRFGRTFTISVGGAVLLLGNGFLAASYFVWMLILGRLISGASTGIFCMIVPIYIAEMSPKDSRGAMGSTFGPAFTIGLLLMLAVNVGFAEFSFGWRLSIATDAFIGLVIAVGMLFLPHSPRWLVMKGRHQEALRVLQKINHGPHKQAVADTTQEFEELKEATIATGSKHQRSYNWQIMKEMFRQKYRLLLGTTIFLVDVVTGVFIFTYSTTLFCEVGLPSFYSSLVSGVSLLLASFAVVFLVDRLGRKTLFLVFTVSNLLCGLAAAVLIQLDDSPGDVVGYTIVVLICVYAFGYSCSWLTLAVLVNSEIYSNDIRGITMGLSSALYYFFSFVMNQLTPLIVGSSLQLHGFFYIVSGFNLFGLFLILFFLPETKGVSLEQMDQLFSQSICERFISTFRCAFCRQKQLQDSKEDVKFKEAEKDRTMNS